jgi:hypothetical protein
MMVGSEVEHALLLCNLFASMGKKAFLVLGQGVPEGKTSVTSLILNFFIDIFLSFSINIYRIILPKCLGISHFLHTYNNPKCFTYVLNSEKAHHH